MCALLRVSRNICQHSARCDAHCSYWQFGASMLASTIKSTLMQQFLCAPRKVGRVAWCRWQILLHLASDPTLMFCWLVISFDYRPQSRVINRYFILASTQTDVMPTDEYLWWSCGRIKMQAFHLSSAWPRSPPFPANLGHMNIQTIPRQEFLLGIW